MFGSNCCFLTSYRFLRRQVRWSGIPISWRILQFVVIHTVKGFGRSRCFSGILLFFLWSNRCWNLISGSSDFSKSSLNLWKFMVPYGRKQRRTKEPLAESERREWKCWLKTHIQKTKIMASDPITSWQIDGETMETVRDFIFGAPKSLQMVTAAMKLKDTCSLEEKLWPT